MRTGLSLFLLVKSLPQALILESTRGNHNPEADILIDVVVPVALSGAAIRAIIDVRTATHHPVLSHPDFVASFWLVTIAKTTKHRWIPRTRFQKKIFMPLRSASLPRVKRKPEQSARGQKYKGLKSPRGNHNPEADNLNEVVVPAALSGAATRAIIDVRTATHHPET